jgi:hypothetical protein
MLLLHVDWQAATPLQKYGAHDCVGFEHMPPRHVPAFVSVAPFAGQVAIEQPVPSGYCWHPPLPSHLPFPPQLEAPSSAQKAAGAGVPAGRAVQVPIPERLQAWQAGQPGAPQQTPSTQLPLMHWLPAPQARPFFLSAQLLVVVPWHVKGGMQSLSLAQTTLHAPVPHTYGEQLLSMGIAHEPVPVQ